MERPHDFVERLEKDMSLKILLYLEDPYDLAAVSGVSKSWRRFVIENGLLKQLCLKLWPDLSKIIDVDELIDKPKRDDISTLDIPSFLTRDHRVFSLLSYGLTSFPSNDQIKDAVCASSTDRYPDERIENTLMEDQLETTYWSSGGEADQTVPETLVYKLAADLCLISEIHVQPYQAFTEPLDPTYSAEAVRFCMCHRRSPLKLSDSSAAQSYDDDMFMWTYTSPEYPMAQTSENQRFRLPRPILCMGGILKIELLGRAQNSYIDGLYYICVSHVQAFGRSLGPLFEISVIDDTGCCIVNRIYGVPSVRNEIDDRRCCYCCY
ncbi:hypothetical protein RND81_05G082700 [Saponaria officinalis]|uniref:F-box domain-containing protein n=1 Tax=Saponaria officinalis TaxID=3572 RepID=A0AAW1KZ24_SAPOF